MALIKHIASKNADYSAAERYLVFQHNETTNKSILNAQGQPVFREGYLIDSINCESPSTFAIECIRSNKEYRINEAKGEIKTHHYIISFDPRDATENGLTPEQAQDMGMKFAQEHFLGHQTLVCTHPDGHHSAGNIHVHLVINSLRIMDTEPLPYKSRSCDNKAGHKHHCSKELLEYLKQETMDMCQQANLYQLDLLTPAKKKISDREYRAQLAGQKQLNERNEKIISAGLTPKITKFETQKEALRIAIDSAIKKCHSLDSFIEILSADHGIVVTESRGRFSYMHPDRNKPVSGRRLGTDYEKDYIEQFIAANNVQSRCSESIPRPKISMDQLKQNRKNTSSKAIKNTQSGTIGRLIDIQNSQKAQESRGYARWAKLHNLKLSAQTMNYLIEHNLLRPEQLSHSLDTAKAAFNEASEALNATQKRLATIRELKKQLSVYLRNKPIHIKYRKVNNKKQFQAEHEAELMLYDAAKSALKTSQVDGKLPTMKLLVAEEKELLSTKNLQYDSHQKAKQLFMELQTIKNNETAIIGDKIIKSPER